MRPHTVLLAAALSLNLVTEAKADASVEIIRDKWGVAHVYGESESAMFFGAGYAMAEDRLFQMTLLRREAQGRLAEMMGAGPEARYLNSDRRLRTLGFHVLAKELFLELDPQTRESLAAFAVGVNDYIDQHRDSLPEIFARYGGAPDPWQPSDCVLLWIRERYGSADWESEVAAKRRQERHLAEHGPSVPLTGNKLVRNNAAAVVSETEFQRSYPEIHARLKNVTRDHKALSGSLPLAVQEPTASHCWAVTGARSTTGGPILESDPQSTVLFPGGFYEMHLVGGQYDVRGALIPGTPGMLIGWNRTLAWGGTALGGDNADLFEERVHPDDPGRYLHRGQWKEFKTRTETIRVKDGAPIEVAVRETIHGPVVNDLLEDVQPREVFAVRHTVRETRRPTLDAALGMMRATDWTSFRRAMSRWVAPPLHVVYADVEGNLGYQSLVATPKRFVAEPFPRKGWTGDEEWDMVPFEELPSMFNPKSETIFSANHMPVGEWYPYLITTSPGQGPRAWRLRELLSGDRKFSVMGFRTIIHTDATNPALRDFVRLAVAVLEEDGIKDRNVKRAVASLKEWDGRLVTDSPLFSLARSILDVLQANADEGSPFSDRYGVRWNGICWLLQDETEAVRRSGKTPQANDVREWLKKTFREGVKLAVHSDVHRPPITHRMPYQSNRSGFDSLAPDYDRVSPPLTCPVKQTIWSQRGGCYVQLVDLANLDRSLSLLPPGISENPESPHASDQVSPWVNGELHPAPITRAAVDAMRESTLQLTFPPMPN